MSWELPPLTTLFLSFVSLWWFRNRQAGYHRALYAVVTFVAVLVDGRKLMPRLYFSAHEAVVNASPLLRFKMVLTLGAVVWLLHRALQTLWKPVPELVNILGVDIPQSPDVCLAGIRSDAATLTWTRPASHRPVQKYLIQVNGVHVGETPGNDAAITVTGLKPSHFYNIRVVAVGHNNFRSGSPVIRLRTFGKDGRPQLGNSRLPANFVDPDQSRADTTDDTDDTDGAGSSLPTVEAAPVLDGTTGASRDVSTTASGQRRNTLNRRHSPSVASADQAQVKSSKSNEPEMSLAELNERFEGIRKEIEDTQQLYAKEQAEASQQEEDLKKERDRKRQVLKEKEEQTTQLKAMIRTTMEQMRAAEKERAKKEQQLKEKETKKTKVRDSITKLENDVERMKTERAGYEAQKTALAEKRDHDVQELGTANTELQDKCAELEAVLKDKGKQLQDLKATREQLPGADDEKWKEEDLRLKREWESKRRELHIRLVAETKQAHQSDQQIRLLTEQVGMQQAQLYAQNPASALDFDPSSAPQSSKRLSFPGNPLSGTPMSSPPPVAPAEPNFQGNTGLSHIGFGPGLFMDITSDSANEPQSEAELKAAGGPLSPSAQTLLPSNIFDDTEDTDIRESQQPRMLPDPITAEDDGPQSPVSPTPSFNAFSSPHGSSHNLPFPQYSDNSDRISLNMNSSPIAPPATSSHRLTNLLSTFHRGSRTGKTAEDDDGPPIGSLKPGQSQSFPRGTEEVETMESRRRYFPWMNRNSTGPDGPFGNLGNLNYFSGRRVNSLKGSRISAISDRDREHSRPPSIGSTDLPRPSTDSGSIWGAPGDNPALKPRMWSPSDNLWPSRSGSRRPSLHGSMNAPTTTLASADDEILDEDDLLDPQTSPSQVGVIGSRPPGASKSISQRLNPNAPTFMANIFRKDKDRGKDKAKDEKGKGALTPSIELPQQEDSPSDSRVSKDTYSVHTGTSVSESRESLQLDSTTSNTPSDMNSVSTSNLKDSENVVRKLFRKGSSSKFSLSSRLGKESGLFKKGPGSASNSDRNTSAEQRSSIGDVDDLGEDTAMFGRSYDSMTSSPALGPAKSKDSRESRMSSWRFSMKKKSKDTPVKEKESLEMDRAPDEE